MPRKDMQKASNKCPKCGTVVTSPIKTWQLVAPLPDAAGRVTVTIMGMFECPNCGFKWRGVVSKMKVGGENIEIEGAKKSFTIDEKKSSRAENVIEIDLSKLAEEEEE
uniref:Chromatin protein Cren7 n=1 Tax=Ignisphaera aggregans TaxID=334771 RepID=A0A7J2TZR5_9CREN